jgi:hypothetical protein
MQRQHLRLPSGNHDLRWHLPSNGGYVWQLQHLSRRLPRLCGFRAGRPPLLPGRQWWDLCPTHSTLIRRTTPQQFGNASGAFPGRDMETWHRDASRCQATGAPAPAARGPIRIRSTREGANPGAFISRVGPVEGSRPMIRTAAELVFARSAVRRTPRAETPLASRPQPYSARLLRKPL